MHVVSGADENAFRERIRLRDWRERAEHGSIWSPDELRPISRARRPTVGPHKGRLVETAVVTSRWRP